MFVKRCQELTFVCFVVFLARPETLTSMMNVAVFRIDLQGRACRVWRNDFHDCFIDLLRRPMVRPITWRGCQVPLPSQDAADYDLLSHDEDCSVTSSLTISGENTAEGLNHWKSMSYPGRFRSARKIGPRPIILDWDCFVCAAMKGKHPSALTLKL